jgi:hypothetical protein
MIRFDSIRFDSIRIESQDIINSITNCDDEDDIMDDDDDMSLDLYEGDDLEDDLRRINEQDRERFMGSVVSPPRTSEAEVRRDYDYDYDYEHCDKNQHHNFAAAATMQMQLPSAIYMSYRC